MVQNHARAGPVFTLRTGRGHITKAVFLDRQGLLDDARWEYFTGVGVILDCLKSARTLPSLLEATPGFKEQWETGLQTCYRTVNVYIDRIIAIDQVLAPGPVDYGLGQEIASQYSFHTPSKSPFPSPSFHTPQKSPSPRPRRSMFARTASRRRELNAKPPPITKTRSESEIKVKPRCEPKAERIHDVLEQSHNELGLIYDHLDSIYATIDPKAKDNQGATTQPANSSVTDYTYAKIAIGARRASRRRSQPCVSRKDLAYAKKEAHAIGARLFEEEPTYLKAASQEDLVRSRSSSPLGATLTSVDTKGYKSLSRPPSREDDASGGSIESLHGQDSGFSLNRLLNRPNVPPPLPPLGPRNAMSGSSSTSSLVRDRELGPTRPTRPATPPPVFVSRCNSTQPLMSRRNSRNMRGVGDDEKTFHKHNAIANAKFALSVDDIHEKGDLDLRCVSLDDPVGVPPHIRATRSSNKLRGPVSRVSSTTSFEMDSFGEGIYEGTGAPPGTSLDSGETGTKYGGETEGTLRGPRCSRSYRCMAIVITVAVVCALGGGMAVGALVFL